MIVSKIIGGLGNQMFQWAFAKSLSLELKKDLFLDTSGYYNQNGLTTRTFQLSNFKSLKYSLWPSFIQNDSPWLKINDNFNYDSTINNVKANFNLYLDGYWQSEKFFNNHKTEIEKDFCLNNVDTSQYNIEPGSVSLHIRRTDYVALSNYHPVQTLSYYKSAIDLIEDYNNLYVFSDDIKWCKANLNFKKMIFVEGKTNLQDLRLMSLCENNIIANSSFSWWGAWLNKNSNKTVIAPKNWFGPSANLNSSDIIPENWITI